MDPLFSSPRCNFIRRFRHGKELGLARFSIDGLRIITCSDGGVHGDAPVINVYVWDVTTGDLLYTSESLQQFDCSANCAYVAINQSGGGQCEIIEVSSGNSILKFAGRCRFVSSRSYALITPFTEWSSLALNLYGRPYLYDLESRQTISRLEFLSDGEIVRDVSVNGESMLTSPPGDPYRRSNVVSMWNIKSGLRICVLDYQERPHLNGHKDAIRKAVFVPGAMSRVLTIVEGAVNCDAQADRDPALIWDVDKACPIAAISCGGSRLTESGGNASRDIYDFAFVGSRWIATIRADEYTGPSEEFFRVHDMTTGDEVAQLTPGVPGMLDNALAVCGGDETSTLVAGRTYDAPFLRLFDAATMTEIAHCAAQALMSDTPIVASAIAPTSVDGQFTLTAHKGGDVCLWRMPDWV